MKRIPALLVAFVVTAGAVGLLSSGIALPAVVGLGRLARASADTINVKNNADAAARSARVRLTGTSLDAGITGIIARTGMPSAA